MQNLKARKDSNDAYRPKDRAYDRYLTILEVEIWQRWDAECSGDQTFVDEKFKPR